MNWEFSWLERPKRQVPSTEPSPACSLAEDCSSQLATVAEVLDPQALCSDRPIVSRHRYLTLIMILLASASCASLDARSDQACEPVGFDGEIVQGFLGVVERNPDSEAAIRE